MNIGYHHHVPSVFESPDRVRVAAHIGMFVEELAKQAGSATYYTYGSSSPTGTEDYHLEAPLVRCVNLGPRSPAPVQFFRPGPIIRRIDFARDGIDALLVRGPGPLLPAMMRHAPVPSAALILGDYRSWIPNVANPAWRNRAIGLFQRVYLRRQAQILQRTLTMTQNKWLLEHAAGSPFPRGRIAFTSSVTEEMVRTIDARSATAREERSPKGPKRILYTGRFVEEKGVLLIVEAVGMLVERGFDVEVEFVGWAPPNDPTPTLIDERAASLKVSDRVTRSGFKTAAGDLIDCYLAADVYVFASPTEWGSSQTITEAMVAGLPVVTSNFEGIRGELEDGHHAVIVAPGSAEALADGLARVLTDEDLREHVVKEGRRWAETRTNERSIATILGHIREWIDAARPAGPSES